MGTLTLAVALGGGWAVASPAVPSEASPRAVSVTAATATPLPTFAYRVRRVTVDDLPYSWHRGCPVGPRSLRLITLRYYGFDRAAHVGKLVVHRSVVKDVVTAFRKAYDKHFPIRRMRLVDRYRASDERSMNADNTSAFNCRRVAGSSHWSRHAYGKAIDINPVENPYVWTSGGERHASPKAGAAYLDRTIRRKGMVWARSTLVRAFKAEGWRWGGQWRSVKDYQHVELR